MSPKVFTTTVTIAGQSVPIQIRRMDVDAWQAFRTEFRHMELRGTRTKLAQETAATDEAFEAALLRDLENDRKATQFMRNTITEYVSAPDAHLVDEGKAPVVTGAELFEYYARNLDALATILAAIWTEHLLSPKQKKALRLAHASGSGSATRPTAKAPVGGKPERTVANVGPSISARSAGATGSRKRGASSGTAAR